jgi:hypothetical protein
MNKIGKDCGNIIWDYYNSMINYEKKIQEILNWDEKNRFYNSEIDIQIFFLDLVYFYKKRKGNVKNVYFKFDKYHPNNEIIKDLKVVLKNKEKYNYPIREIIKLKDSQTLYVLL